MIYFSTVLLLSALLSIPTQARLTAVTCTCLVGIAGLICSALLAIRQGVSYQTPFGPFPYAVFRLVAFAFMVAGGLLLLPRA